MDNKSLKDSINHLVEKSGTTGLTVEQILENLGVRSHALLILFFSIPFVQPVPMVGVSVPFGVAIMLFGIYYFLDKTPWLPTKFRKIHIKAGFINKCGGALIKILQKTEKLIKPRMKNFVTSKPIKFLNVFLIIIFAFLLSLPLPIPMSNSVPAYFMLLNALAILEEDGYLLLLSYVMAIIGFVFFWGISALIVEVCKAFFLKLSTL